MGLGSGSEVGGGGAEETATSAPSPPAAAEAADLAGEEAGVDDDEEGGAGDGEHCDQGRAEVVYDFRCRLFSVGDGGGGRGGPLEFVV